MDIIPTSRGLRLMQHGVVISELRTSPGPTHSVFDVLAAMLVLLRPGGRIGVLGFAGGGMMAPLQALGYRTRFAAVDLDRASYKLFCKHCPDWVRQVKWHHADAVAWLRRQKPGFDLLLEDLSVPQARDVVKPIISWNVLPALLRQRLKQGGVAVVNLVAPPPEGWREGLSRFAREFPVVQLVLLDEFENRILIAGETLMPATVTGLRLRELLRSVRSRQATRVRVRSVRAKSE